MSINKINIDKIFDEVFDEIENRDAEKERKYNEAKEKFYADNYKNIVVSVIKQILEIKVKEVGNIARIGLDKDFDRYGYLFLKDRNKGCRIFHDIVNSLNNDLKDSKLSKLLAKNSLGVECSYELYNSDDWFIAHDKVLAKLVSVDNEKVNKEK